MIRSRFPTAAARAGCLAVAAGLAAQQDAPAGVLSARELVERRAELTPRLPAVRWLPSGKVFSIVSRRAGESGPEEVAFLRDERGQAVAELFGAAGARALLRLAGAAIEDGPDLPPFGWHDDDTVRFELADGVYHWRRAAPAANAVLAFPPGATARALAPGDLRGAFVVRGDLVVAERDGTRRRITWDGGPDIAYGGAAHRAEFGIRDGLWWDAAGRYLAFSREDLRPIEPYPFADYGTIPARPVHGRYPMAGRPHSVVRIGVHDTVTRDTVYLRAGPPADRYWTNVTFGPDGATVWVALVDRGQTTVELVEFGCGDGEPRRIVLRESDPAWIEPEHGPAFLPDGRFLWLSFRDGHRHLFELSPEGRVLRQVTRGPFDVAELLAVAPDGSRCWVAASGDDPRELHAWRVDLDGTESAMTRLTEEPGWHEPLVAPETGHLLDRWSRPDLPGVLELVPAGGEPVTVFLAKNPLGELPACGQRLFEVEAGDGTILYGHLLLPPDFDPARRYPVLHYVYGGPHSQLVRRAWNGGAPLWLYWMAGRGYVVSRLDNRGTSNRGRAFEQAVHRRLGTLEVHDQLAAIAWLRAQGFADDRRIGVHGWSYGGYLTLRLMLLAPDTFCCGVAGAPVTDWARYETGYTERYMDTPAENPDGYRDASCLPLADRLRGRLLLVHGTDDHTVMLSHSMAFLRACIDAGKLVDFMAYPMQQHGIRGGDTAHLYELMTRHFDEHLRAR